MAVLIEQIGSVVHRPQNSGHSLTQVILFFCVFLAVFWRCLSIAVAPDKNLLVVPRRNTAAGSGGAGTQYLDSFGGSPHSHLPVVQLYRATPRLIISSRHWLRVTMNAVR
jgi:hypothetical protein